MTRVKFPLPPPRAPTRPFPSSWCWQRQDAGLRQPPKARRNLIVPTLVSRYYRCRVLSFFLKRVAQDRASPGPVRLGYKDPQQPVSQPAQAFSMRAPLALGPPSRKQSTGGATAPSHRSAGGAGKQERGSAGFRAPFLLLPCPGSGALLIALHVANFQSFPHLRHGNGKRVTEPGRRGGGWRAPPRGA